MRSSSPRPPTRATCCCTTRSCTGRTRTPWATRRSSPTPTTRRPSRRITTAFAGAAPMRRPSPKPRPARSRWPWPRATPCPNRPSACSRPAPLCSSRTTCTTAPSASAATASSRTTAAASWARARTARPTRARSRSKTRRPRAPTGTRPTGACRSTASGSRATGASRTTRTTTTAGTRRSTTTATRTSEARGRTSTWRRRMPRRCRRVGRGLDRPEHHAGRRHRRHDGHRRPHPRRPSRRRPNYFLEGGDLSYCDGVNGDGVDFITAFTANTGQPCFSGGAFANCVGPFVWEGCLEFCTPGSAGPQPDPYCKDTCELHPQNTDPYSYYGSYGANAIYNPDASYIYDPSVLAYGAFSESDGGGVASNGVCEDGGPGSEYSACALGTDCADCGSRAPSPLPPAQPPPSPSPPAPPPLPPPMEKTDARAIVIADFDDDGDDDVYFAVYGQANELYVNQGDSPATFEITYATPAASAARDRGAGATTATAPSTCSWAGGLRGRQQRLSRRRGAHAQRRRRVVRQPMLGDFPPGGVVHQLSIGDANEDGAVDVIVEIEHYTGELWSIRTWALATARAHPPFGGCSRTVGAQRRPLVRASRRLRLPRAQGRPTLTATTFAPSRAASRNSFGRHRGSAPSVVAGFDDVLPPHGRRRRLAAPT